MKRVRNNDQVSVLYVDAVGGHRGMHYYDFELCPALIAAGIDVTLLTCDETQSTSVPPLLPVEYPFQRIYGSDSRLVRGVRYLLGLIRVGQAVERRNIPLVHLHYTHVLPLDCLFVEWLHFRRRRLVFTAHDVTPFNAKVSDLRWLGRLYDAADCVITHAVTNRDTLIEAYRIDPGKVRVVPMGPYLRFAQEHTVPSVEAREQLGLEPSSPVVLFFGQIKRVKGLGHLLCAFQQVVDRLPTARLIIAGPEWKDPFDVYAAQISELGLSNKTLTRIEYVPDDEVGTYFSSASVVVLPYTEAYQSAVLYMAYSFGKPVVASAVGGLVEVVEDGVTGLLVPPADESRLADALLSLLLNEGLAQCMGQRGRLVVETRFGWSEIAKKTAAIYTETLSIPGREGTAA